MQSVETNCSNCWKNHQPTQSFLLVSEAPESILPTLTSRMQRFNLPPLNEEDIAGLLRTRYMLQPEDASDIAHLSAGSVLRAIENIHFRRREPTFL